LILDPLALEMVRVGEQTGALPELLGSLAEFLDEDLDVRVATLMSLMEPVILAGLAVSVGIMVLAFYLPLFESFALMQANR
jgi:type IV pilus assembly protein PilC